MNKLVIFDLDNTLIAGDSDRNWGQFLSEEGLVEEGYLEKSEEFYKGYYDGTLNIMDFLDFCGQPLKNNSMELLLDKRKKFLDLKIKPILLKKGLEEVKKIKGLGFKVIIATATNSFVTRPIAEIFSIKDLIATEFEIVDNAFTGKIVGNPCFQEGKLKKVKEWCEINNFDLRQATFYSDSFNDLPLLNEVGNAVIVDGDDQLKATAKTNKWECISFR